jgi:hypothetical protein
MADAQLVGSVHLLFLYDVSERIRLDELRRILGADLPKQEHSVRGPGPAYVRFEEPPVEESVEPVALASGERLNIRLKYYQYGVASVSLELGFECGWPALVNLANRWVGSAELEQQAESILQRHLERVSATLVSPYPKRLSEDYGIVYLRQIISDQHGRMSAAMLLNRNGSEIAQIVRGERLCLSPEEEKEVLQSRMSYYPDDLAVVGWSAAFVYDSPDGALPMMQILEYANSQLLDLRHYDELLTIVLAEVYTDLDKRPNFWTRWHMAREAERLNTIRLDVEELTERMNNSIKFLSDMYSARFYRLAAAKIGVLDYHRLVDEKLQTAADLYRAMMDQFHQGRAFILELMVVIILIIDLIFLFKNQT